MGLASLTHPTFGDTFGVVGVGRHARGLIGDPVGKAKSVVLTEAGLAESERLFAALFGRQRGDAA